jgi:hypothetical protein
MKQRKCTLILRPCRALSELMRALDFRRMSHLLKMRFPRGMILVHALPHPTGIIALADDKRSCGTYRKPPEERQAQSPADVAWFSLQHDPPPVPDRPDLDGETCQEDLDLAHLTPQ